MWSTGGGGVGPNGHRRLAGDQVWRRPTAVFVGGATESEREREEGIQEDGWLTRKLTPWSEARGEDVRRRNDARRLADGEDGNGENGGDPGRPSMIPLAWR